jgi:hypothetical protein
MRMPSAAAKTASRLASPVVWRPSVKSTRRRSLLSVGNNARAVRKASSKFVAEPSTWLSNELDEGTPGWTRRSTAADAPKITRPASSDGPNDRANPRAASSKARRAGEVLSERSMTEGNRRGAVHSLSPAMAARSAPP